MSRLRPTCDYLIQFGTQAGTATRHGFNMTADKFARRRAEDGLRLVNFDPHMSAGAEKADLWVPIRPGSDAAAALAMAYVFIHELDLIDRDYLVERPTPRPLSIPRPSACCAPRAATNRCTGTRPPTPPSPTTSARSRPSRASTRWTA